MKIIPGWNWSSFDEFHGYNGDCMEYALEMCLAAVLDRRPLVTNMNHLVQLFQEHGWAGSNGATTINACISYVQQEGYHIITSYGYQEPARFDMDLIDVFAGEYPILLNLANGRALHDGWSGESDEPTLHYHGIAILGKLDNGNFACADGDNPSAADGKYEAYSMASLVAANPCGLLIFTR